MPRTPLALLLFLAAGGRADADDAAAASAAAVAAAGAQDDECAAADGGEACALNALQRRLRLSHRTGSHGVPPDFTLDRDNVMPSDEDDEVDDDEEDDDVGDRHLWVRGVDKVAVTGCYGVNGTEATECPKGETCVVKYDGSYSQCVDCSKHAFGQECQKLDDYMRYAAVHTCKRTCEDAKCYNNHWCRKPYKCVVDKTANWGQCVSCRKKAKFWTYGCKDKSVSFLNAAHKVCKRKCKVGYPDR